MGICENQYKFVKEYALDKINSPDVKMLELGDQVLNNHQNFFDGIKTEEAQTEPGIAPSDVMSDKEALELLRSYYAIPENQRRRLFDLARVLSDVS